MFESMDIADYFVQSSLSQGIEINNLKLQKLLYYFYAMYLLENQENPFNEGFEKWQYGPVLPSVYHAYKQFGGFDISELPDHYRYNEETDEFEEYTFRDTDLPRDLRNVIDNFVDAFRDRSPFELVERTHTHTEWKKDEALINMGIKNLEYNDKATIDYFRNNVEEQLWQQRTN